MANYYKFGITSTFKTGYECTSSKYNIKANDKIEIVPELEKTASMRCMLTMRIFSQNLTIWRTFICETLFDDCKDIL